MTFDLVVLAVVGVFTFLGALSGFSRQVAQAAAAVTAFLVAGPAGRALTPALAPHLGSSLTAGSVAGWVLSFVVVYFVVRGLLTLFLRGLIAGPKQEGRARDRWLGALLSGAKASALVYLGVCAAVFLERNVVVGGKRFELTPRDSVVVSFARDHNVLEWQQFPGADELMRALKASSAGDGGVAEKGALAGNPAYAELAKDPRFKALLKQKGVREALEQGDVRALLSMNEVVQFIRDPEMRARLEALDR